MSGPDVRTAVAVVIPVRDGADLVLDAVESVRRQGRVVAEIVAVDNGSTDATVEVLTAGGVTVVAEATPGAGAARKRGLALTGAPYVLFLDHDDVLRDGAVSTLLERIVSSAADVAYGAAVNELLDPDLLPSRILHLDQAHSAPISSASLVARSAFRRYGAMGDDNFSWARWLLAAQRAGARVEVVDETVCTRRIHGRNVSLGPDSRRELFALVREHRRASDA